MRPPLPRPQPTPTPPGSHRRRLVARGLWALGVGLAVGLGPGLVPLPAQAGRDDGQRVRAAREQGRILPLEQLIAQVAQVVPGRLLQAELEDEDGRWVYELRWQLADGRRLEIELDASDGRWLKLKGPRLETVFAPASGRTASPARGPGAGR